MNKNRDDLLAQKKQEVTTDLERWCLEHGILGPGEKLECEMHIISCPAVTVNIARKKTASKKGIALPPDKREGESRSVWRLSEEDWISLTELEWREEEMRILKLLQERKNEPIQISAKTSLEKQRFTTRFNTALKGVGSYDCLNHTGFYYKLIQIVCRSGFYAIRKYGYF